MLSLLVTTILGLYNFSLKNILGTSLYFTFSYLLCKKYPAEKYTILITLLIPLILILFFINILDFKKAWVSLPGNIFLLFGCLGGFIYNKTKQLFIVITLILLLSSWEFTGKRLFTNKMNFGTFDQKVLTFYPSIELTDSSTLALKTSDTDKIIILDFWNSGCSPCFRLFPIINSVNRKIDSNKFDIRLVNIPVNGEKKEDNYRILNRFPYTLKQLFAEDEYVADSFKIVSYPTTLIIKNNKIVFRGEFENAVKEMSKL